ncbi:hypothetical protein BDZ85DRAFT_29880 [Elsinoe ampelina]|uniref:Uncharacterized protein n=1 Tax=Elsinoe ampelina TaxID=302913 RepID=A0A6A6G4M7_9PEZI|nr:hypothetical protein BDZ85DRAFT_29880 [Elsinoe ampelina]
MRRERHFTQKARAGLFFRHGGHSCSPLACSGNLAGWWRDLEGRVSELPGRVTRLCMAALSCQEGALSSSSCVSPSPPRHQSGHIRLAGIPPGSMWVACSALRVRLIAAHGVTLLRERRFVVGGRWIVEDEVKIGVVYQVYQVDCRCERFPRCNALYNKVRFALVRQRHLET